MFIEELRELWSSGLTLEVELSSDMIRAWLVSENREEDVPIESILSLWGAITRDLSLISSPINRLIHATIAAIFESHGGYNLVLFLASELLPVSNGHPSIRQMCFSIILQCCEWRIQIQTSEALDHSFDLLMSSVIIRAASKVTHQSSLPPIIKIVSQAAKFKPSFVFFFRLTIDLMTICLSSPASSTLVSTLIEESIKASSLDLIFFLVEHLRLSPLIALRGKGGNEPSTMTLEEAEAIAHILTRSIISLKDPVLSLMTLELLPSLFWGSKSQWRKLGVDLASVAFDSPAPSNCLEVSFSHLMRGAEDEDASVRTKAMSTLTTMTPNVILSLFLGESDSWTRLSIMVADRLGDGAKSVRSKSFQVVSHLLSIKAERSQSDQDRDSLTRFKVQMFEAWIDPLSTLLSIDSSSQGDKPLFTKSLVDSISNAVPFLSLLSIILSSVLTSQVVTSQVVKLVTLMPLSLLLIKSATFSPGQAKEVARVWVDSIVTLGHPPPSAGAAQSMIDLAKQNKQMSDSLRQLGCTSLHRLIQNEEALELQPIMESLLLISHFASNSDPELEASNKDSQAECHILIRTLIVLLNFLTDENTAMVDKECKDMLNVCVLRALQALSRMHNSLMESDFSILSSLWASVTNSCDLDVLDAFMVLLTIIKSPSHLKDLLDDSQTALSRCAASSQDSSTSSKQSSIPLRQLIGYVKLLEASFHRYGQEVEDFRVKITSELKGDDGIDNKGEEEEVEVERTEDGAVAVESGGHYMRGEEIKQRVRMAVEDLIEEWSNDATTRLPFLLSLVSNPLENTILRGEALKALGVLFCLSSKLAQCHGQVVGQILLAATPQLDPIAEDLLDVMEDEGAGYREPKGAGYREPKGAGYREPKGADISHFPLHATAVQLVAKMIDSNANSNGWLIGPLEVMIIKSLEDLNLSPLAKLSITVFAQVLTSEKVVISPSSFSVLSRLLLSTTPEVSYFAVAVISKLSAGSQLSTSATSSKKRPLATISTSQATGTGSIKIYLSLLSSCDERREELVTRILDLSSPSDLAHDLFTLPILGLILSSTSNTSGDKDLVGASSLLLSHMTPSTKALQVCLQSLEGGNDLSHHLESERVVPRLRAFISRHKQGAGGGGQEGRGVQVKVLEALDALKPRKKSSRTRT